MLDGLAFYRAPGYARPWTRCSRSAGARCAHDLDFIRDLIAASPRASRALSFKLCDAWAWTQPNGAPCDAVCRALMLELHRAGTSRCRRPVWRSGAPDRDRRRHRSTSRRSPSRALADLGPLDIRQVRRTPDEDLVKSLVQEHHYLGYVHPVGEHLKYLVSAGGQPIACFCWSSAPRHLGPRDRHIGWSPAARKANIRFVAYQSRFLILPWVKVPHLASHLLGASRGGSPPTGSSVYAHPIYFTETFVDPDRFRGTCYRAANWTVLGMTLGLGKDARTSEPNRSLKQLLGYPLVKDFRQRLCAGA